MLEHPRPLQAGEPRREVDLGVPGAEGQELLNLNGTAVPPVPLALEAVGDDEVGYVAGILLRDSGNGDALDVVDASRSRAL